MEDAHGILHADWLCRPIAILLHSAGDLLILSGFTITDQRVKMSLREGGRATDETILSILREIASWKTLAATQKGLAKWLGIKIIRQGFEAAGPDHRNQPGRSGPGSTG
jgi:hypothetical protein